LVVGRLQFSLAFGSEQFSLAVGLPVASFADVLCVVVENTTMEYLPLFVVEDALSVHHVSLPLAFVLDLARAFALDFARAAGRHVVVFFAPAVALKLWVFLVRVFQDV
jgi:hypothetical protein